jgi:ClpP class serine protease
MIYKFAEKIKMSITAIITGSIGVISFILIILNYLDKTAKNK